MSHPTTGFERRHIDLRDDPPGLHDTQVIDTGGLFINDALTMAPPAGATAVGLEHHWDDDLDEPQRSHRGFGGPFGALVALLVSGAVMALALSAGSLPSRVRTALRDSLDVTSAHNVLGWWSVVLFTLAAVWCWTAAGRARRGRRWFRFLLWGLLGLVTLAASLVELLQLRTWITRIDAFDRWGLPPYVVAHPLAVVVALALALPVLGLVIGASGAVRELLVAGVALYVVGSLVVAGGSWHVSPRADQQAVATLGFEWGGMVLLMLAAALEHVRPRRRRG